MRNRKPNLPRAGLGALASALIIALSACGGDTVETAAADADADGATTQATAAPVQEARLSTVDCGTPADGRVFFRTGGAVLAVPAGQILTAIPPGVTADTPASDLVERLRAQTQAGAGCPEKPLDVAVLAVSGGAADPLLAGEIAFAASPAGTIAQPYERLVGQFRANPERCQQMEGGLMACGVIDTAGAQERRLVYLVTTDRQRTLSFGGPLAARCLLGEGDQVRGCEIVDELPGDIAVRAPLKALPQSTEALAAAHRAVVARVAELRR